MFPLLVLVSALASSGQTPVPASACWAVTDVSEKTRVLSLIDPWSQLHQLRRHTMLDGAIGYVSEPIVRMVIVHPFPDQDLIKISAYSNADADLPDSSFTDLEARLQQADELEGKLVRCSEIGETDGIAYF
ncbi:hypothetical protein [Wenzhouxiangella marina]|nr:hypothetical protein [Wenzhouxiangella marina]MBB6087062.1 hypothetical protein [Wenzhouxiangella marina]